jgi:hypothetical protein
VILVKLADRLHNMRTIRAMKPEKQVQKARETMEIFAPLAGRMGMQSMREDLEDLSFRVLKPRGAPVYYPPFCVPAKGNWRRHRADQIRYAIGVGKGRCPR